LGARCRYAPAVPTRRHCSSERPHGKQSSVVHMAVTIHRSPGMSVCVRLCPFVSVCVRLCPFVSVCVRLCPFVSARTSVSSALSNATCLEFRRCRDRQERREFVADTSGHVAAAEQSARARSGSGDSGSTTVQQFDKITLHQPFEEPSGDMLYDHRQWAGAYAAH
jgi:hypothetical protein